MMRLMRMVLAVVALAGSVGAAHAAPVAPAAVAATAGESAVTAVQYRGRVYARPAYRGRYYGRWRGPVIGLGVGTAIVAGAIIANQAYRPRRGYYYDTYAYDGPYYYPSGYNGDPRKICAEHFRSFEWQTGLYTTYGGERKLCPYLRS